MRGIARCSVEGGRGDHGPQDFCPRSSSALGVRGEGRGEEPSASEDFRGGVYVDYSYIVNSSDRHARRLQSAVILAMVTAMPAPPLPGPEQLFRQLRGNVIDGDPAERILLAQRAYADAAFVVPRKAYFLFEWALDRLLKTRNDEACVIAAPTTTQQRIDSAPDPLSLSTALPVSIRSTGTSSSTFSAQKT